VRPPTIVMVVNKPDLFKGQYERYFLNQLREHLPYSEVPIKLVFSERKRMKIGELLSRSRNRSAGDAGPEGDAGVGSDDDGDDE
jgi:GTP-binding protein